MQVAKFSDLIKWTRDMHHRLGECLARASAQSDQELAKMLLAYLADHEAALEKMVDGFEKQADPKALNTWVQDYTGNKPIDPAWANDPPFAEMSFDEICEAVFKLHNRVIDLYRFMLERAEITEAQDLVRALLDLEEHHTMQLAQQINRMQDI